MGHRRRTTATRNRKIFAAFADGISIDELAEKHRLTVARLREIIRLERLRRAVSTEAIYRALRQEPQP